MTLRPTLFAGIAALIIGLMLAGCGGLAGEPQIVATLPPPTAIPAPQQPPDAALGAQIFAQHCASCHGIGGKGDGELVLTGQIAKPADFTNPATTADQTPIDWYSTITNGRLQNGMPPWADALSDSERWSVAMYSYTLSDSQDEIAHGRDLFNADCAACDTGVFTSVSQMAALSGNDLARRIADQPALADLSSADQQAVAAYLRTLTLINAEAIGTIAAQPTAEAGAAQASTAQPLPASTLEVGSGTVSGQVTNGTAGGSVPADIPLTLFIFDAQFNQQQAEGTINADGSYTFNGVTLDSTFTYVVTANYRDRVFASDILSGEALTADMGDGTLDLPVTIYELTEDADVIRIVGMVTQVSAIGDNLEVAQVFNVTNTSDRAFTTSQTTNDGTPISLAITLPPGAVIAGFPGDQNRYVVDQDNFSFFDTVPVLPGEQHLVQVVYLIPYNGGAIIEQPINYAVQGPIRLLVLPTSVGVTSAQLQSRGLETVGTTQYQSYGAELSLAAGDVVRYEISGASSATASTPVVTSNNLLLIVGIVLVIVALLSGGLIVIAGRNRAGDQQVIDILVRQIAELDADHDAGNLPDDVYERQRAALKARLAALMERKK